jgi:predicted permease
MSYLREALRELRNGGTTTLLAFAILVLAMSAGTITFSVVDAVLLRGLPYSSPERLVGISRKALSSQTPGLLSPAEYFTILEGTSVFASVAASRPHNAIRLGVSADLETVRAVAVTANLFETLGIQPRLGRSFGPEHAHPGGPSDVIVSHRLWGRLFGSDTGVIGQTLMVNGAPRQVIGVLAAGTWYPINTGPEPEIYIPYIATAAERANGRVFMMSVVGRLRPGVTVERARTDVARISTSATVVLPLHDQVVGPVGQWLILLLSAVGSVLLVACFNVASLLLVQATVRAREYAIREVLGASRLRSATVGILSGMVLSLASASAALVISAWSVDLVRAAFPPGLFARASTITIDARVLAAAMATAGLSAVFFGTAPTWMLARRAPISVITSSGGPVIGGRNVERLLACFLVGEIVVVCVLAVATTLVVRSFILISTMDLGFERKHLVSIGYTRQISDIPRVQRSAAAASLRVATSRGIGS